MHECPKCGGTEGYTYILVVTYNQYCSWEGNLINDEDAFTRGRDEGRMVECVECGARFRRSTIERETDE